MRSPVVARTKDSRLNPPLTLRRLVAPKGPGPLPRRSSFFEGSKAALLAWAVVLALIIGSCLWYLTTVQMDSPTPVPTFRDYSSILNGSDYYLSLKGVSCPDGQPLIRFEVEECRALAAYFGGSFEGEVVEKYRPGTCYRKNDYWFVNLQPTNFLSSPRSQDEVPCLLLEDYPIYHSSFQPSNYFLSPVALWTIQVVVTVLGHMLSVVLAHDLSVKLFGHKQSDKTQYIFLFITVALTLQALFVLSVP